MTWTCTYCKTGSSANFVSNNLAHFIDANNMLQALQPSFSDAIQLLQNPHLAGLVHKNDPAMAFCIEAIQDDDETIALVEAKVPGRV